MLANAPRIAKSGGKKQGRKNQVCESKKVTRSLSFMIQSTNIFLCCTHELPSDYTEMWLPDLWPTFILVVSAMEFNYLKQFISPFKLCIKSNKDSNLGSLAVTF